MKSLKRNAILNTIRQICAVIFPLITFPYVSRVLGVNNYGKINFAAAIIVYFSLIAALGIQNYAVREGARLRDDEKKLNMFANQVFSVNVIMTIISYLLLFGLWLVWDKLHDYTLLITIQSLVIICATIGCDWINVIFEDYLYISIRYIVIQLIAVICMFMFVKTREDYIIYAMITVAAQSGAELFNVFYIRRYVKVRLIFKDIEFVKHVVPMLVLFGNAIAVNIYINSDITILGIFENEKQVGLYSMATKIYGIIKQVVNAIIVVIIPRIAVLLEQNKKEEYNKLLNDTKKGILVILMPIIVGLFMVSEETVILVGGIEYIESANVLKILCISLLFAVFAYFFTSGILIPNRKEKVCLYATIVAAVINIVLNLILIPFCGKYGAAITTVIAEFAVVLISSVEVKKLYSSGKVGKLELTSVIGCIVMVLECILMKQMINNVYIRLGIDVTICAISYMIILFTTNRSFFRKIFGLKK